MTRPLRDALNESNPNKTPSALQIVREGDALASVTAEVVGAVAADTMILPENQRAAEIVRAFRTAGGATGYCAVVAPEGAVAAGQVAVDPAGNVLFAAADAVTAAEVLYVPVQGDVIEDTNVPVTAAGVATLLAARRGLVLLQVELLTGATPGTKLIVARGTAVPAAGQAALQVGGTTVNFVAAEVGAAGGTARIRYVATPGIGDQRAALAGRLASQVSL